MARWKLIIDDYGKISHAEIEMSSLMLFVGDNNSGKSYLTSLLWGLHNYGVDFFLDDMGKYLNREEQELLLSWMTEKTEILRAEGKVEAPLGKIGDVLTCVLNRALMEKKNQLTKHIFNSEDITIGGLRIEVIEPAQTRVRFSLMQDSVLLDIEHDGKFTRSVSMSPKVSERFLENEQLSKSVKLMLFKTILSDILGFDGISQYENTEIYLPSARTGFMLTKDIINRFSRNQIFNLNETEEKVAPFVRPINHFLDIMSDLSWDGKGKKEQLEIAELMEKKIIQGTLDISSLPNKEVQYFPAGKKDGMQLRLVSAVVTELAPLMLLLKHKEFIQRLYYEEPEMCLHPQLQQKMARILCRIVNAGIGLVVTTHSDIILQHINNMIKLSLLSEERAKMLGYGSSDLLRSSQVKVYQFEGNERTIVSELSCSENGFAVPTFNHALDLIMEEAYQIQGE